MSEKILYQEKMFSKGITIIMSVFALLIFVGIGLKKITEDHTSDPWWIFPLFFAFFLLLTINFSILKITVTRKHLQVNYGIFYRKMHWKDITLLELDEKNYMYGWGIRWGRYKGSWVWVFNKIGGPRVVFLKKKGIGTIVSSDNPKKLLQVCNTLIHNT